MEIDARIPLMAQGPDIVGAQEKAMTMKQMALGNQQKQQDLDYNGQLKQMDMIARLASGIKDQTSYDSALAEANKMGLDVSQLPRAYDPGLVNNLLNRSVSYLDRLKNDREQYALSLDERKTRAAELKAANSGDNLPIDSKEVVQDLSKKNAAKISIKNQINSVLKNWDNLSDDQKVYTGQQLIKTLNSTEGQDAVGNQERDVLAGKLNFALGNFTNSQPTQFGRDLEGFKEQANNVSKSIDGAIESNQSEVDRRMGRPAKQVVNQDSEAVKWAKANPRDPRAQKILELNKNVAGR